ncbi:hypothetical protein DFO73_110180 [Cytobacillus oceanisediminis]|uniref:Uncharacterized protein n=1 Tax=Cytobacillus oceanisediminis TaxID=665099 RepID=A0A2V2ZQL9_9BACI|nr:hypothetical protein [Cytobacillus oceanisediminis]PWW26606.1 hypothetical protein DFO73_110180 [Cytobacillus oceanisediminis]
MSIFKNIFSRKKKVNEQPVIAASRQQIITIPIGTRVPRNKEVDDLINKALEKNAKRMKELEQVFR